MTAEYKVLRADECIIELELIFDHLFETYIDFGDAPEDAFMRAERRLLKIDASISALALAPHQGTLMPEVMDGLRRVAKDDAVFYFTVDDDRSEIRFLAVFFGGQDHQRHMLVRLLNRD